LLIIEIALGIVLGVLILRFFGEILSLAIVIAVITAIALVIALAYFRLAPNLPSHWDRENVTIFLRLFIAFAAMFGIPYWFFNKIAATKSKLGAIFRGDPPFDRSSYKAYWRVAIVTPFILATAIIRGVVGAFVGYGMTTRF